MPYECDFCFKEDVGMDKHLLVLQSRPSDPTELVPIMYTCTDCAEDYCKTVDEVEEAIKSSRPDRKSTYGITLVVSPKVISDFYDQRDPFQYNLIFLTI